MVKGWSGSKGRTFALILCLSFAVGTLGAYWVGDADWMPVTITGYDGSELVPVYLGVPFVAVGPDDALHMTCSISEDLGGQLVHGRQGESGWSWSTVHNLGVVGAAPMVVDSEGTTHICSIAYSPSNLTVVYSTDRTGEWQSATVGWKALAHSVSIAADSDGAAHIAFWSFGDLLYTTNRDGHWDTYVIVDNPDDNETYTEYYTGSTSIALDESQKPHIVATYDSAYVGVYNQEDQGWVEHTLFDSDLTFDKTSIVSADGGRLHVAYYGGTLRRGLALATCSDGEWHTHVLEAISDVQLFHVSMTCDSRGEPWISYSAQWVDIRLGELAEVHRWVKVARPVVGGWSVNTIVDDVYSDSSIALDSHGAAYLSITRSISSYWTRPVAMDYRLSEGLPAGITLGIVTFVGCWTLNSWLDGRGRRRAGKSQQPVASETKQ